jgi:hypothetical protein
MPTYHVSKGSEFKYLEKMFHGPSFMEKYDAALEALADPDSTSTLIAAANRRHEENPEDLSMNDLNHFTKHWLDEWWTQLAVADTLRAGMIEAIKHAQAVEKPMEVLWVCASDAVFHLYYSESPSQVTVLVFTALPPTGHVTERDASEEFPDVLLVEPEDIWVVKKGDEYDGDSYRALGGTDTVVSPVEQVASVTTEAAESGASIIKQRLYHT